MTSYAPFDRDQLFLLPPDLKDWLLEDDLAPFIAAAAEGVRLGAFRTNRQAGGKPQHHPLLCQRRVLVAAHRAGDLSGYRRAVYRRRHASRARHDRDVSPDQLRRTSKAAFEAAFLDVLLLARESGILQLGTVSIDGTKRRHQAPAPRSTPTRRKSVRCGTIGRRRCARGWPPTSPN